MSCLLRDRKVLSRNCCRISRKSVRWMDGGGCPWYRMGALKWNRVRYDEHIFPPVLPVGQFPPFRSG